MLGICFQLWTKKNKKTWWVIRTETNYGRSDPDTLSPGAAEGFFWTKIELHHTRDQVISGFDNNKKSIYCWLWFCLWDLLLMLVMFLGFFFFSAWIWENSIAVLFLLCFGPHHTFSLLRGRMCVSTLARVQKKKRRFLCLKYQITAPCECTSTLMQEEIFVWGGCERRIGPERKSERLTFSGGICWPWLCLAAFRWAWAWACVQVVPAHRERLALAEISLNNECLFFFKKTRTWLHAAQNFFLSFLQS